MIYEQKEWGKETQGKAMKREKRKKRKIDGYKSDKDKKNERR